MGQCKDCKFWKDSDDCGVGTCTEWLISLDRPFIGMMTHAPANNAVSLRTAAGFGCAHFEERERGPFTLIIYEPAPRQPYEQAICFEPTGKEYPLGTTKKAEVICPRDLIEWLNERWAERPDDGTV